MAENPLWGLVLSWSLAAELGGQSHSIVSLRTRLRHLPDWGELRVLLLVGLHSSFYLSPPVSPALLSHAFHYFYPLFPLSWSLSSAFSFFALLVAPLCLCPSWVFSCLFFGSYQ